MYLHHLRCTECSTHLVPDRPHGLCPGCGAPLAACYDLARVAAAVDRDALAARGGSMWRFAEVLPAPSCEAIVSLGEGGTPLLDLPRLGAALGLRRLQLKDEAQNPTGSFKARGMSAAVTMAKAFGAAALAAPSAGNAGGALAAYGARAGLPVHLAMPRDVPRANRVEAELCGAEVTLIDGTIADCGAWLKERAREHGWTDVSTLKEPYRVEGKKTMGYELALQLGWTLPDAILYPTGGGTGLVGMVKAFEEMCALGWLPKDVELPRMIAVQAEGCAPIVAAFHSGAERATAPAHPATIASGLRVPSAVGDRWILRDVRRTKGTAVAVSDERLLEGTRRLARAEGVFAAPEAGALVAALEDLVASGELRENDHVVLFDTGAGIKYLDEFEV